MPISSLSSQRNLNHILLKNKRVMRKQLSLFLQLCTDLKNKYFISSFEIKIVRSFFTLSTFLCKVNKVFQ